MKKRGRPRQFDEDEVTDAMMTLFWRQGFAATSLDDISAATELSRPSLYSAFGSKADMYILCLDKFAERMMGVFEAAFAQAETLDGALTNFYAGLVDVYFAGSKKKEGLGCLVFSTAVAEAPAHKDIQKAVAAGLQAVTQSLRQNIVQHRPGRPKQSVDMAVEVALSTFLGLGVQVRSGKKRKDVERAIRNSVAAIEALLK